MATVEARKRAREAYVKRKDDAQECYSCKNPRAPNRSRCTACLAQYSAKSKEKYLANIEEGRRKAREFGRKRWRLDPEAMRAYARKRYKENPDRSRNSEYRRRYGITLAEYDALFNLQQGLCAICGKVPTIGKRAPGKEKRPPLLCVDHDHKSGRVRGLLCHWCNTNIIAGIEKSGASLESIFEYLRR